MITRVSEVITKPIFKVSSYNNVKPFSIAFYASDYIIDNIVFIEMASIS